MPHYDYDKDYPFAAFITNLGIAHLSLLSKRKRALQHFPQVNSPSPLRRQPPLRWGLWQNRRLVLFARGSFFETDSPGRGRWHKVPEGEQLASHK